MFQFAFSNVVFVALAAVVAVLLFLFMLSRSRRNAMAGNARAGLKMGYILCAAGCLCTGASIVWFMAVRSEVEGVFFLFHSIAKNRSESYRVSAVLMCIGGLTILGIGLINIIHVMRKKAQPSQGRTSHYVDSARTAYVQRESAFPGGGETEDEPR